MKTISVLLFLLIAASIHAQLAVIVSPPQVTGDKAIVPLELKNNFNQGVASARAAVLSEVSLELGESQGDNQNRATAL